MKIKEYMDSLGLTSKEDLRLHLRDNMLTGRSPVSIYSCPDCETILNDITQPCTGCGKDFNAKDK